MLPYLLELIWWVVTAVVVLAVLYPIHKAMYIWRFETWNIAFVIILITLTRYVFLLDTTFLAKRQVVKVVGILLMFPLMFILVNGFHSFLQYIEDFTWDPITGHLPPEERHSAEQYIWNEMLFFGTGSIIATPITAGRLFWSVWKTRNKA